MFSQRERLPRAQFETVLKTGRRYSSAHFLAVVSERARGYAVIIPKKVVRLSTARHRLKRHILEALRTISLPPALIIFPKSSGSSVSYQNIEAELKELLSTLPANQYHL